MEKVEKLTLQKKKLTKIEKRHKEELEALLESLRQDALENKNNKRRI